jgi:hypothetical protein
MRGYIYKILVLILVTTLVNEQRSPGTYSVEWNASAFPSGIYFYKIKSGAYIETKRMIFLK